MSNSMDPISLGKMLDNMTEKEIKDFEKSLEAKGNNQVYFQYREKVNRFFNGDESLTKCFIDLYNYQALTVKNLKFNVGDGNIIGFKRDGERFLAYVQKKWNGYFLKTQTNSDLIPFSLSKFELLKEAINNNNAVIFSNYLTEQSKNLAEPKVGNVTQDNKSNADSIDVVDNITDIIGESTGIESNAFQEEVKYAQNNYQYFGDEINKEEKLMPYSDVGPYDTGIDYDDIADIQYKKSRNKPHWDTIDKLRRYFDADALYCGHLRTNRDVFFSDEVPTTGIKQEGADILIVSTDDAKYKAYFDMWKYPKKGSNILYSRNIDMENRSVQNVDIVFDASNELYSGISDLFLRNALMRNKSRSNIQSIIQTIQEKQNEIRVMDPNVSFVVQGCAGSGKTMVLLHRLKYLIYNEYLKYSDYYFLVPSRGFKSFIKNISSSFRIQYDNIWSYTDYYKMLLGKYTEKENEEKDESVFPVEYLTKIYSDSFIKANYWFFADYLNTILNKLIDKCDSKLTELIEVEKQAIIEDRNNRLNDTYKKFSVSITKFQPLITVSFNNNVEDMSIIVDELNNIYQRSKNKYEAEKEKITDFSISQSVLDKYILDDKDLSQLQIDIKQEEERIKKASIFTFLSHKHKLQSLENRYNDTLDKLKRRVTEIEKNKYLESLLAYTKVYNNLTIEDLKLTIVEAEELLGAAKSISIDIQEIKNDVNAFFSEKLKDEIKTLQETIEYSENFETEFSELVKSLDSCVEKIKPYIEKTTRLISLFDKHFIDKKENIALKEEFKIFIAKTPAQINEYLYNILFNHCKKVLKEEFGYILCDQYKHYWFLALYFNYIIKGDSSKYRRYIYIDEAQDLSLAEMNLIYKYNYYNEAPVINLFGDVNQVITTYGIKTWTDIKYVNRTFLLDENFRNTNQVVEFCNSNLPFKMTPVGVSMNDVLAFNKVNEAIDTNKKDLIFIVKDDYVYDDLYEYLNKLKIDNYTIYTVKQVKGLEFKEVFVVNAGMTDNEKYISYTRALISLNVITEVLSKNNNRGSKIIQGLDIDLSTASDNDSSEVTKTFSGELTIVQAAAEVLSGNSNGLTIKEIYNLIVSRNLYEFHAQDPENVLKIQIRRACEGVEMSSSREEKLFKIVKETDGQTFYTIK